MHIDIFHSLAEVPPATWNSLAWEAGLYSSHEWLTTVEAGTQGYCRYLLARDESRAVGALPVYFVTAEPNQYYDPRSVFRDAPAVAAGCCQCLAGSRSGYSNEPLLAPGLSEEQQRAVTGALLGGLISLAGEEGSANAFFLFLNERGQHRITAAAPGIRPVLSYSGDTWLDVTGESFDDYLAQLSKTRRKSTRKEIRSFGRQNLRVTREDPRDHVALVVKFARKVKERYGIVVSLHEQVAESRRQCETLGDRGVLFSCHGADGVLGVALGYVWHDWLFMRMSGFDYESLPGTYEYFNTAIYEPLKYCYETGLRGLHLGTGSPHAKLLRGARISPLVSLALPVRNAPAADLATKAARSGVRRYWEQQFAAMPLHFDTGKWAPLLDLCCRSED
jgi:uncharacterized protein